MAADVIVLNLWAHDVGRADGQAYSVLRSVFEEAVRLYEEEQGQGIKGQVATGGDLRQDSSSAAAGAGPIGGGTRFPKVRWGRCYFYTFEVYH